MAAQISSNSSQHGATLQAALLSIALQAKAAYEAAYDSAQIRGGSELDVAAAGAEDSATIGEVALHAITQCDWLIEQCRAVPGAPVQRPSAALNSKPSSSAAIAMDDDMPDWLLSAASDLAPEANAPVVPEANAPVMRSASFKARRRRTPKVAD